jgi:two-component system, cell cycle sensor histidine kinase and response regulator CckA
MARREPDGRRGSLETPGGVAVVSLAQLPLPALVLSDDGCVLSWNDAGARLLGLQGRTAPIRVAEPFAPWLRKLLADVDGEGRGRARVSRREAGARRVLELHVSRYGAHELVALVRDCTGQQERNRARREQDRRLRQALDVLNEAALIEQDGRITYANEAAARLLGRPRSDLENIPVTRILDAAALRRMNRLLAGEATSASLELMVRRGSGSTVGVQVAAVPLEYGRRPARQLLLRDLTAQRQAEAGLRALHERLRLISESVRDHAIITVDAGGRIASWNSSAERLTGYKAADMIRTPFAVLHTGTADEVAAPFMERAEGVRGESEVVLRRRDGATFHAQLTVTPLLYASEQVDGYAVVIRDLTERRRAEENLRRSEEQLRHSQKMDAIGRLAAGIAHDFNNILTAIQGHVQFLLEDLPGDLSARDDAAEIGKAADRAAELTRQLLTFARRQPTQPAVLNVNDVVKGLEKLMRRLLRADVELDTVLREVPPVFADPGQIEQVLVNLVVNAREALPEGGRITVSTSRISLDEMYSARGLSLAPGEYVQIAVSDNGIGMSVAMQRDIFEPFFTTKAEGTGLGLSTAYGIVTQAGGHISVYSEEGVGTTFKVFLPVQASAATPPEELRGTGAGTVLLVEDDDAVRALARRTLANAGFAVLEATEGGAALRLAREHPGTIDVVVTDLMMPEMGGEELAARVREMQPDVGIVLMSGFTESSVVLEGRIGEPNRFLEKPFTPASLTAVVREALRTARPKGSSPRRTRPVRGAG